MISCSFGHTVLGTRVLRVLSVSGKEGYGFPVFSRAAVGRVLTTALSKDKRQRASTMNKNIGIVKELQHTIKATIA
jgi:hypothetical protein